MDYRYILYIYTVSIDTYNNGSEVIYNRDMRFYKLKKTLIFKKYTLPLKKLKAPTRPH